VTRANPHPTAEQIAAADPTRSAWVGANAGSGKTRVLTQRVARLLLAGADPGQILCLTFTKAAAAEMQNRLFDMLGDWAMASDARLGQTLAAIEGATEPLADAARLAAARRLFARALETPGGLKIQTIHAFCEALLRRFPLEAGISPGFTVIDEHQRALILNEIRGELADAAETGVDTAFDGVADRLNEDDLDGLAQGVLANREHFASGDIEGHLRSLFGEVAALDTDKLAEMALAELDWPRLRTHAEQLAAHGGKTDRETAQAIAEAISWEERRPWAAAEALARGFLTQKREPRSRNGFPSKAVLEIDPAAGAVTDRLIAWAVWYRDRENAREMAARARALHHFAKALLARYTRRKARAALVDFDDLITIARRLLTRSDLRAWVLYRLDAGIDHLLVDEAQDTSPAQWSVIEAITEEFHTGAGARTASRTIFAVGDEKQSIYSFQGAAPEAFDTMRVRFAERLDAIGSALARPNLITSFRSAPEILGFVDVVFASEMAGALDNSSDPVCHLAFRKHDAARIDLWTPLEPADKPVRRNWWDPVDAPTPDDPKLRLATMLADEIARMIAEERLPPREGAPGRSITPGDILILVRRRDALAKSLIRALKARDLPVAGADRLTLADELSVKDLLAVAKVALMPSDDLTLAAALRSPLCGLGEDQLFALAHGREGTLWQALMAAESAHPGPAGMLRDMAARADYLRPYAFLEHLLIAHDGRRSLLARLGSEAEDPIDELLAQAMAFERAEIPTLDRFIHWIESAEITVKREMDRGAGEIRLMTVHGAKGLEAPVVILPDTFAAPSAGRRGPQLVPAGESEDAPMLWLAGKQADDTIAARARARADSREAAEHRRLLYVALTRAEDWLILCGALPRNGPPEGAWYTALKAGMARCGGRELPGPVPAIARWRHEPAEPPDAPVPDKATPPAAGKRPAPPDWLSPAPREPRPVRTAPSHLVAETAGSGAGRGRAAALAHGSAVHTLLERLADIAPADRRAVAERVLDRAFPELSPESRAAATAETLEVFAQPFAEWMFGPGSLGEAPLALSLEDGAGGAARMLGRIDRLVIASDHLVLIDFKTDASPPETPEAVPPAYLAQLAAYTEALGAAAPGRPVTAHLLWTRGPYLMEIAPALLACASAAARESGQG